MIPVAKLEGLLPTREATFEVFPYVEFKSSAPSKFSSFSQAQGGVSPPSAIKRGVIDVDILEFKQFIRNLQIRLEIPVDAIGISDIESRALLISRLLRLRIAKSRDNSHYSVLKNWQSEKSKNRVLLLDEQLREEKSVFLLLGDLYQGLVPGFYRSISSEDFVNWGIPKNFVSNLSNRSAERLERKAPEPDGSSSMYWAQFAYAMSTEQEFTFEVEFSWELGRKIISFYRKSGRGSSTKIGEFIPEVGSILADLVADLGNGRVNAKTFFPRLAWSSRALLKFFNEVSGLKAKIPPDLRWSEFQDREKICETTRESVKIFEKSQAGYRESRFGEFSDCFLFTACLSSEGRRLEEEISSESIDLLMHSFFLSLRFQLTYEGTRGTTSRLNSLYFHLFPQLSLNDSKRVVACQEMVGRLSERERRQTLFTLLRSGDAFDFFSFLDKFLGYRELEEIESAQRDLILTLRRSSSSSGYDARSKGISQMQDGLYNTYGAER